MIFPLTLIKKEVVLEYQVAFDVLNKVNGPVW